VNRFVGSLEASVLLSVSLLQLSLLDILEFCRLNGLGQVSYAYLYTVIRHFT